MNKYIQALQDYAIAKKDMSYCKCGKPNQVGGFTCKQHCKHGKADKKHLLLKSNKEYNKLCEATNT